MTDCICLLFNLELDCCFHSVLLHGVTLGPWIVLPCHSAYVEESPVMFKLTPERGFQNAALQIQSQPEEVRKILFFKKKSYFF